MNPTPTSKPSKPSKPTDNRLRVLHGGGWNHNGPSWVRAASRSAVEPAIRGGSLGFRCALRGREPRDPSKVGL